MAFQAVPNTAQIDMIYTSNGITVQNVFYAELPAPYSQADLQALADAIDLTFAVTFVTELVADVTYLRTEVRGLAFANDLVAQSSVSTGPGTHAGGPLPNQVSFALKKSSGLTGRSARGRTFWISVPANEITSGNENLLKVVYADQILADVDFIRITIATVGLWLPVLVSRFEDKVKRPIGVTFPWNSTSYVDLTVDTQRNRLG